MAIKPRRGEVRGSRFSLRTMPVGGVNNRRIPIGTDGAPPTFCRAAPDKGGRAFRQGDRVKHERSWL
jgi:hypothetical protein